MTDRFKPVAVAFGIFAWTGCLAFGQSTGAKLEFEVASIKPAAPMTDGRIMVGMGVEAGRLTYTNVALRDIVRTAYRVKDYQIQGPDWMAAQRFDVVAKLPEGATREQVPEMLQALLADRFKLTLHHDTKDHQIYALIVGKGGPKLQEADPNGEINMDSLTKGSGPNVGGGGGGGGYSNTNVSFERRQSTTVNDKEAPKGAAGGGGGRGMMMMKMGPAGAEIQAKKTSLTNFADMLSRFVDRPVIDMTEIQGIYDFNLNVASEELARGKMVMIGGAAMGAHGAGGGMEGKGGPSEGLPADSGPGGTIFQSIQKYGLKLDPRKAPMDTIVVDHVEKTATDN